MKIKIISSLVGFVIVLLIISGYSINRSPIELKGYVLIPEGKTSIDGKDYYSLSSFWICDHEVTNKEYNDFLNSLLKNEEFDKYELAKIENENWTLFTGTLNEPYSKYYGTQESFSEFPVVNISYNAAKLYCMWLTSKLDEKLEVRLPTRAEWIYAASGGEGSRVYSWDGIFLKNRKGELMCNYKAIGDECIHTDSTNQIEVKFNSNILPSLMTPSLSYSYSANNFGLYNVCGNVAEMIVDEGIAVGGSWNSTGYDVRVMSAIKYLKPNPFVGFRPIIEILDH